MAESLKQRAWAGVLLGVVALGLQGCPGALRWDEHAPGRGAAQPVPAMHTVRVGESLYAIALRYELQASDIARWNRLGSGDLIFPGQELRLRPPRVRASAPAAEREAHAPPAPAALPSFRWPARGTVVSTFGDPDGVGKGIDIKGNRGDPVLASDGGRVVYSGDGLIGYGNLIIVKHNERYLSAYGYNDALLVREGDQVSAGQAIASMGLGPERRPMLHFEIREMGKPVDPQRFLPGQ